MSTQHICQFCGKLYVRKTAYTQHILMCEISKKNIYNTNRDHIPSNKELYQIIINLNNKYERLQQDYDILKRFVDTRQRKIDVLEWLNKNYIFPRDNTFESIFMNIQLTREHLNMVFENDYINGITYILSENCMNNNSCIKAFSHREGIFYIYDINKVTQNDCVENDCVENNYEKEDDLNWQIMENSDFDRLIKSIDSKLLFVFKEWHLETEKIMDEDKFSELYIKNLKKIMGGNFKICEKLGKIKNRLYKIIKSDIKNYYSILF